GARTASTSPRAAGTRRRSERLKRPSDVRADQLADGGFGEPERFAVGAQRKLLEEDPVDHFVDVAIVTDFADIDRLVQDRSPEVPFDTTEPFVDHDLGDPRGRLAAGDDGPEVRMLEHGQNSEVGGLDDAIEPFSSGDLLSEGGEQVGRLTDDDLEDHVLLRAEVRVDRRSGDPCLPSDVIHARLAEAALVDAGEGRFVDPIDWPLPKERLRPADIRGPLCDCHDRGHLTENIDIFPELSIL